MKRTCHVLLFLAWVSAVSIGLALLWRYEGVPGVEAAATTAWPASCSLPSSSERWTLLLFAHPQCPCTQASLSELQELLARPHRNGVDTYVFFYRPERSPADWEKTRLYRQAQDIPGVHVVSDAGGTNARLFHASTSGQVLLFDARRQLRFRGGITVARGHAGANLGQEAVAALLSGQSVEQNHYPVFGCSLLGRVTP